MNGHGAVGSGADCRYTSKKPRWRRAAVTHKISQGVTYVNRSTVARRAIGALEAISDAIERLHSDAEAVRRWLRMQRRERPCGE